MSERLLRRFAIGDRVRASMRVVFVIEEVEIDEGALGTIKQTKIHGCDPLYGVEWDSLPGRLIATSCDCFDPVPS